MEITAEHKKKIRELQKSSLKHGFKLALKVNLLLVLATAVVVTLDYLMGHSEPFCFVGGGMNAIFIFRMWSRELSKEHDRVREEVKKILSE